MNTARIWCSSIATLVLVGCVSSQTLVTECVHRDSTGHVIYLENEYRDGDTSLYYCAFSNGARLLKQWSRTEGDTVIEYFQCNELTSRLYPDVLGDEWMVSRSPDSMWISIADGGTAVWDTVLTYEKGEAFWVLKDRYEKDYAALVHDEVVPFTLAAARLRETWEFQTTNSLPSRFCVYGHQGDLTNRVHFKVQGDTLVARSYFEPEARSYAIDSITWNADASVIKAVNQRLDWGERYQFTLELYKDSTVVKSNEERFVNEWVYDHTPWYVRLREATLAEGPLCSSWIARMRVSLPSRSYSSNGYYTVSEHSWDQSGRLLGSAILHNGHIERRISYSYH